MLKCRESKRCYLQIRRKDIAFFKFLLEAHDNLGLMTVVDKYEAVLQLSYAPGQEEEIHVFLEGISREIVLKGVF